MQNGLPETVSGGALNLNRSFNGYGEVDSQDFTVGSQNVTSWTLSRDNNGRITQKTETINGVISSYLYTYDSMGRLLTVAKDGILVEEYGYDLSGTRISETNTLRGIAARSFSYSDEDHLLSAGTVTYSYDLKDGFLTTKTDGSDVTSYNYSSRGELLSVNLPDGRVIEYLHDPLGRRIAKKVDYVIIEKFLWQGLTQLLAVYDGSDNLLMRFDYADSRMPVAVNAEGATYYLTYDQVGSLRAVADGAGNVVKSIQYDSFGNIINDTNPAFEMPFGFAGGLHDQDTGLVRFGYRDYDPDIGRWTAKDPILFAGGDTDLYGYVLNDPITFVDPFGLSYLNFDSAMNEISLYDKSGIRVGSWKAANNPCSGSEAFPQGKYPFSWQSPHSGDGPNSSFGSHGNSIFEVPKREGMGVHSGRANEGGYQHCTEGCIRTTDEATNKIKETHKTDPLTHINVIGR